MFQHKKKEKEDKPKHVEIWGHLVDLNRGLKRMLLVSAMITLVSVCGMTWLMATALKKPLVYYVNPSGVASFGGRIGEASRPLEVEASYVAKEFLRKSIAFDSFTIEKDLADGFNLMTAALQKQQEVQLNAYKLERGQSFVEYVQGQNIRTSIDFTKMELQFDGEQHFTVRTTGILRTWPISANKEAEPQERSFESQLTLLVVARTEATPNGLLVSHQSIQFFEAEDVASDLEDVKGL